MTPPKLTNSLRSNRKRLALFQNEVAFLLGTRGGAKVSRYENFSREPSLRTALAFQAIYKKPASELFSRMYQQIERDVAKRAKIMTHRKDWKPSAMTTRKRETITSLAQINQ